MKKINLIFWTLLFLLASCSASPAQTEEWILCSVNHVAISKSGKKAAPCLTRFTSKDRFFLYDLHIKGTLTNVPDKNEAKKTAAELTYAFDFDLDSRTLEKRYNILQEREVSQIDKQKFTSSGEPMADESYERLVEGRLLGGGFVSDTSFEVEKEEAVVNVEEEKLVTEVGEKSSPKAALMTRVAYKDKKDQIKVLLIDIELEGIMARYTPPMPTKGQGLTINRGYNILVSEDAFALFQNSGLFQLKSKDDVAPVFIYFYANGKKIQSVNTE